VHDSAVMQVPHPWIKSCFMLKPTLYLLTNISIFFITFAVTNSDLTTGLPWQICWAMTISLLMENLSRRKWRWVYKELPEKNKVNLIYVTNWIMFPFGKILTLVINKILHNVYA
jgi:hypothetical protein